MTVLHAILEAGACSAGGGIDASPFFNAYLMKCIVVVSVEPIAFPDAGAVSHEDARAMYSLVDGIDPRLLPRRRMSSSPSAAAAAALLMPPPLCCRCRCRCRRRRRRRHHCRCPCPCCCCRRCAATAAAASAAAVAFAATSAATSADAAATAFCCLIVVFPRARTVHTAATKAQPKSARAQPEPPSRRG